MFCWFERYPRIADIGVNHWPGSMNKRFLIPHILSAKWICNFWVCKRSNRLSKRNSTSGCLCRRSNRWSKRNSTSGCLCRRSNRNFISGCILLHVLLLLGKKDNDRKSDKDNSKEK